MRPWFVDDCIRIESRTRTSHEHLSSSPTAVGARRRNAVQQTIGSKTGGGRNGSCERHRRLRVPPQQARQEGFLRSRCGGSQAESETEARKTRCWQSASTRCKLDGAPDARGVGSSAKILGSDAPDILVPQLMNSLPRLLLRSGGSLASFLHSMLSKRPDLRDEGTQPALWPVPIPYPEAFRTSKPEEWRKRRLSLQIVVMDWLFLGKPAACPSSLRLGVRLSSRQWKTVLLLESLAEDLNSIFCVSAQEMGRTAAKTELHDNEIGALHRACDTLKVHYGGAGFCPRVGRSGNGSVNPETEGKWGSCVGAISAVDHVAAKPIVASRIKFGPPPLFDPLPFLDERTAAMYECPQSFFKDLPDEPPKVAVRATADEKLSLFRRMASCGRLANTLQACSRSERMLNLIA